MAVPSFPIDPADMQLFRSIDPGGAMARECWSDYSKKLALWRGNRAHFEQFCARWHSQHRAKLASLVRSPQMVRSMLARVGYMRVRFIFCMAGLAPAMQKMNRTRYMQIN